MSKKLLEESTVRSFMKLANLQPLTQKFITEKFAVNEKEELEKDKLEEEELEEEVQEEGEALEEGDGQLPHNSKDRSKDERDAHSDVTEESLQEEVVEEEADVQEEGKETEGRPASPKAKVKGVAKPGKMTGVNSKDQKDHKLTPLKAGTHHSDKPDSIETKNKSNAPKKNNQVFDKIHESLEEMADGMEEADMDVPEAPEADAGMGSAGESGDHQEKMKGLIRSMLNTLKDMGGEYGMSMEISDEGADGEPEAVSPESEPEAPVGGDEEGMMQEKLDEMVEKLTKRVAARLVKESKKKR